MYFMTSIGESNVLKVYCHTLGEKLLFNISAFSKLFCLPHTVKSPIAVLQTESQE